MQEQYKEMEEFLGKDYLMVSQEGFEAYLEFMGLGYFKRKIAVNVRTTQTLTKNEDGTYRFHLRAAVFNFDIVFTPGVEFESVKADGSKVQALITFEGNVMTHIQIDDEGRTSKHVLEFFPEESIVTTTIRGSDLVAKRVYKLVQP